MTAMNNKLFCVALLIDLTKAFNTVDHQIVVNWCWLVGVWHNVASWVLSYLRIALSMSDWEMSLILLSELKVPLRVQSWGHCSFYCIEIASVISWLTVLINCSVDTIFYSSAPSFEAAVSNLQSDFFSLQHSFIEAKFLPHNNKTPISTLYCTVIELLTHILRQLAKQKSKF